MVQADLQLDIIIHIDRDLRGILLRTKGHHFADTVDGGKALFTGGMDGINVTVAGFFQEIRADTVFIGIQFIDRDRSEDTHPLGADGIVDRILDVSSCRLHFLNAGSTHLLRRSDPRGKCFYIVIAKSP